MKLISIPPNMLGTPLVFLLLSANLNVQSLEVTDSVEAEHRISLLEDELQSLYNSNTTHPDVIEELEEQLSNLYNGEDVEEGRSGRNELDLIRNKWSHLEEGVTLMHFSPDDYSDLYDEEIWEKGNPIRCTVNNDHTVDLKLPRGFQNKLPTKIFAHGFKSKVTTKNLAFVDAWMNRYNQKVNVILLNWPGLALSDLESPSIYTSAAKNAIDVGAYLGHCLAAISKEARAVEGSDIHLVGHSLGAHLVGKAGRVYNALTRRSIGRVTGLDPAAPRFIEGGKGFEASIFFGNENPIGILFKNRLNQNSGSFVDVIHTDGSLRPSFSRYGIPNLGDLNQMGHADFYPDGGEKQSSCLLPGCSHGRAIVYYLDSIRDPNLFPSVSCANLDDCREGYLDPNGQKSYMGHLAKDYRSRDRNMMYYVDIEGY